MNQFSFPQTPFQGQQPGGRPSGAPGKKQGHVRERTEAEAVNLGGLGELDSLRQRDRRRAYAKGLRLERLVQVALEAQGAKVERAPKVVHWRPGELGEKPKPFTSRHDFFGVADFIVLFPDGRRSLIQVTTLTNVAAKRVKFLRAGVQATSDDAILAHERGRRFRELRGPDFAMPGRTLMLPALPKKPKAVAAKKP